jgi:hypothetical protein
MQLSRRRSAILREEGRSPPYEFNKLMPSFNSAID